MPFNLYLDAYLSKVLKCCYQPILLSNIKKSFWMVSEDGLRVAISIIKKRNNTKTGED